MSTRAYMIFIFLWSVDEKNFLVNFDDTWYVWI